MLSVGSSSFVHPHTPPRVKRCARRDSNSQRTVFKTAASYRLGYARRLERLYTGGEIRTHISRSLKAVCLRLHHSRALMLGEGIEPSMGLAHGRLSAARLPFTPPQLGRLRGKDSNPRLLFQRQASSLWTTPDCLRANPARLERAPSGSASLRSDPSELRVQGKG